MYEKGKSKNIKMKIQGFKEAIQRVSHPLTEREKLKIQLRLEGFEEEDIDQALSSTFSGRVGGVLDLMEKALSGKISIDKVTEKIQTVEIIEARVREIETSRHMNKNLYK